MTLTTQRLTLADYCRYDDGSNTRYELLDGELVPMALGVGQHGEIADFLNRQFYQAITQDNQPWVSKQMVIGVQSPRAGRWDTVRIPDVTVIPIEQWRSLQTREAVILRNETPPLLVVEVVSESTQKTDYRAKRAEYSVLEIPEYWLVDPLAEKVTVLVLDAGWYNEAEFVGEEKIQSLLFPHLSLTVAKILQGDL